MENLKILLRFTSIWVISTILTLSASADQNAWSTTKEEWSEEINKTLPIGFCKDIDVIASCLGLNEDQCMKDFIITTEKCIDMHSQFMKSEFHMPEEGVFWGGVIGKCAGEEFSKIHADKYDPKKSNCTDPDFWIK